MKKFLLITFFLNTTLLLAQVGMNIPNPKGVYHIDGSKNNPKGEVPNKEQQKDDFIVLSNGNVGIGTIAPENKLHIKADSNLLKLEGLQNGSIDFEKLLIVDDNGIVKTTTLEKASIPQPSVLTLTQDINNFLNGVGNNSKQRITSLAMGKNTIPGLSFNPLTSTVTFPKGMYRINFVYEATHDSRNCTLSSYFVDFPSNEGTTKIHTTASHLEGGISSHGGTITFVFYLENYTTNWVVELGRGQSGNCTASYPYYNSSGMILLKNSTQIFIYKIGD